MALGNQENEMKNLFVGNMSFETKEEDLRALFEPFGQIARVHIAVDRETGRSRGFGFVEMSNDAEATQAMTALDGKAVNGRNLKVNEARPKTERGGPRGFAGPAGGGKGRGGNRFSNEDYRESARQPREPRW
jgi:RNA recognition motif-containing protein